MVYLFIPIMMFDVFEVGLANPGFDVALCGEIVASAATSAANCWETSVFDQTTDALN